MEEQAAASDGSRMPGRHYPHVVLWSSSNDYTKPLSFDSSS